MKHNVRSLASSFILHGKIQTTLAKAKVVKPVVEKLASLAKKNSLSSRRRLQSFLQEPSLVNKLTDKIKNSTRTSGFTRLIYTSTRRGDNAPLARLEWVDSTHETHKTPKTHSIRKPK